MKDARLLAILALVSLLAVIVEARGCQACDTDSECQRECFAQCLQIHGDDEKAITPCWRVCADVFGEVELEDIDLEPDEPEHYPDNMED